MRVRTISAQDFTEETTSGGTYASPDVKTGVARDLGPVISTGYLLEVTGYVQGIGIPVLYGSMDGTNWVCLAWGVAAYGDGAFFTPPIECSGYQYVRWDVWWAEDSAAQIGTFDGTVLWKVGSLAGASLPVVITRVSSSTLVTSSQTFPALPAPLLCKGYELWLGVRQYTDGTFTARLKARGPASGVVGVATLINGSARAAATYNQEGSILYTGAHQFRAQVDVTGGPTTGAEMCCLVAQRLGAPI